MGNSAFNKGQSGNATEIGAGVVKLATQAQIDAKQAADAGVPLVVTPDKLPASGVEISDFNAGEDLAKGDAVFLAHYYPANVDAINNFDLETELDMTPTIWWAQRFTAPSGAIDITNVGSWFGDTGSSGQPFVTVRVRSTLTGADIASNTVQIFTTTGAFVGVDVTGLLTPGDQYYLVCSSNTATVGRGTQWKTTDQTAIPDGEQWKSIDTGANWIQQNTTGDGDDLLLRVQVLEDASLGHNKVWKGNASAWNTRFGFAGFVKEAATTGNPVTIVSNWKTDLFTGLTPGATYYLQDTDGAIGTTPGTLAFPLGIAKSATELVNYPLNGGGFAALPIAIPTGTTYFQMPGFLVSGNNSTNSSCTYYRPPIIGESSLVSIFTTPPVRTTDTVYITRGMVAAMSSTGGLFYPFMNSG